MSWFVIKAALMAAPCVACLIELALVWFTLRPSRRTMMWLVMFGLVASYKFLVFRGLGGDAFNPLLPQGVVVAWGWMESVIWVALPVSVVAVLFAAVVRPFRRLAFPTVIVLSLVLATYGMWEGVRVPPVVEREVVVEDLPAEFEGYRIAHLSDLHGSSAARRGKFAAIVERVNAAKPDLVAITGDMVDGFPEYRADDLEPLKGLAPKDGTFICSGNHECYFSIDRWEPYYERWGLRTLRNAWTEIRRGNGRLVIGGLDDGSIGERPSLVFDGAPSDGCRILLQHRPLSCERNGQTLGVRLQLSGHTHGGAMPLLSHLVALENEGHVRGFYREGRLLLHVSPGTGQWAGFPLRLFNPSEISILTLKRR